MLTFGLVVEGNDDEAALKELVQKCASGDATVMGRRCGNRVRLMQKFPGFLEEFRHIKEGTSVDKALVVRDADNKDPAKLLVTMEGKVANRTYPFPIKLLVVVQELEAWLLADEHAVSVVTGKGAPIVQHPEKLYDPKERLKSVLSAAKISYTPEIARKIAASANVDAIESRCPSFKRFREAVLDC